MYVGFFVLAERNAMEETHFWALGKQGDLHQIWRFLGERVNFWLDSDKTWSFRPPIEGFTRSFCLLEGPKAVMNSRSRRDKRKKCSGHTN